MARLHFPGKHSKSGRIRVNYQPQQESNGMEEDTAEATSDISKNLALFRYAFGDSDEEEFQGFSLTDICRAQSQSQLLGKDDCQPEEDFEGFSASDIRSSQARLQMSEKVKKQLKSKDWESELHPGSKRVRTSSCSSAACAVPSSLIQEGYRTNKEAGGGREHPQPALDSPYSNGNSVGSTRVRSGMRSVERRSYAELNKHGFADSGWDLGRSFSGNDRASRRCDGRGGGDPLPATPQWSPPAAVHSTRVSTPSTKASRPKGSELQSSQRIKQETNDGANRLDPLPEVTGSSSNKRNGDLLATDLVPLLETDSGAFPALNALSTADCDGDRLPSALVDSPFGLPENGLLPMTERDVLSLSDCRVLPPVDGGLLLLNEECISTLSSSETKAGVVQTETSSNAAVSPELSVVGDVLDLGDRGLPLESVKESNLMPDVSSELSARSDGKHTLVEAASILGNFADSLANVADDSVPDGDSKSAPEGQGTPKSASDAPTSEAASLNVVANEQTSVEMALPKNEGLGVNGVDLLRPLRVCVHKLPSELSDVAAPEVENAILDAVAGTDEGLPRDDLTNGKSVMATSAASIYPDVSGADPTTESAKRKRCPGAAAVDTAGRKRTRGSDDVTPSTPDKSLIVEGKRAWKPTAKVQLKMCEGESVFGHQRSPIRPPRDDVSAGVSGLKKNISKYAESISRKAASSGRYSGSRGKRASGGSSSSSCNSVEAGPECEPSVAVAAPTADPDDSLNAAKIERILRSQWEGRLRHSSPEPTAGDGPSSKSVAAVTCEPTTISRSSAQQTTRHILRKARLQLNRRTLKKLRQPSSLHRLSEQFQKDQLGLHSAVRLSSFPTIHLQPVDPTVTTVHLAPASVLPALAVTSPAPAVPAPTPPGVLAAPVEASTSLPESELREPASRHRHHHRHRRRRHHHKSRSASKRHAHKRKGPKATVASSVGRHLRSKSLSESAVATPPLLPTPLIQSANPPRDEPRGPRIKHVCRRAAVVLGLSRAKFPSAVAGDSVLPFSLPPRPTAAEGEPAAISRPKHRKLRLPVRVGKVSKSRPVNSGRRQRCGECEGCLTPPCGKCLRCLDSVKFGGPGKMKQVCFDRVCRRLETEVKKVVKTKRPVGQAAPADSGVRSAANTSAASDGAAFDTVIELDADAVLAGKDSADGGGECARVTRRPLAIAVASARGGTLASASADGATTVDQCGGGEEEEGLATAVAGAVVVPRLAKHGEKARCTFMSSRTPCQRIESQARTGTTFSRTRHFSGSTSSKSSAPPKTGLLRVDFWDDYDPKEEYNCGMALVSSSPLLLISACFLCGSGGKEDLIFCILCCEPFHLFCLDAQDAPSKDNIENWCCRRCQLCNVCGQPENLMKCNRCDNAYHAHCLGPRYPSKPTKRKKIWVCSRCVRCKSCGATSPGDSSGDQWMCNFSFCSDCGKLMEKGNFCPICKVCYEDDDYDSKMVQCSNCNSWVHAVCDNITDETYQMMSFLPDSVVYTCPVCCTECPPVWRSTLLSELSRQLKSVVSVLLKCKSAQKILMLEEHLDEGADVKPFKTSVNVSTCGKRLVPVVVDVNPRVVHRHHHLTDSLHVDAPKNPPLKDVKDCAVARRNSVVRDSTSEADHVSRRFSDASAAEQDAGSTGSKNPLSPLTLKRCDYSGSADVDAGTTSKENSPIDLLGVQAKLEALKYSTVAEFCDDMLQLVSHLAVPKNSNHRCTIKRLLHKHLRRAFPWFQVDGEGCGKGRDHQVSVSIPDAVMPPSSDHTYSRYRFSPLSVSFKQLDILRSVEGGGLRKDTRRCRLCEALGDDEPTGCGRLLYAGQDDWVHVNCALWSSEVFEEVDGSLQMVHSALARGAKMRCVDCRRLGATLGCCHGNCSATYHFRCASAAGATFVKNGSVYCRAHHGLADQAVVRGEDFRVAHTMYVDLDNLHPKWTKRGWLQGLAAADVHLLSGSLSVARLGRIVETSDRGDVLVPVDFECSRVYWSLLNPRKRAVYRCRVVLEEAGERRVQVRLPLTVNRTIEHFSTVAVEECPSADLEQPRIEADAAGIVSPPTEPDLLPLLPSADPAAAIKSVEELECHSKMEPGGVPEAEERRMAVFLLDAGDAAGKESRDDILETKNWVDVIGEDCDRKGSESKGLSADLASFLNDIFGCEVNDALGAVALDKLESAGEVKLGFEGEVIASIRATAGLNRLLEGNGGCAGERAARRKPPCAEINNNYPSSPNANLARVTSSPSRPNAFRWKIHRGSAGDNVAAIENRRFFTSPHRKVIHYKHFRAPLKMRCGTGKNAEMRVPLTHCVPVECGGGGGGSAGRAVPSFLTASSSSVLPAATNVSFDDHRLSLKDYDDVVAGDQTLEDHGGDYIGVVDRDVDWKVSAVGWMDLPALPVRRTADESAGTATRTPNVSLSSAAGDGAASVMTSSTHPRGAGGPTPPTAVERGGGSGGGSRSTGPAVPGRDHSGAVLKCPTCKRVYRTEESFGRHVASCDFLLDSGSSSSSDEEQEEKDTTPLTAPTVPGSSTMSGNNFAASKVIAPCEQISLPASSSGVGGNTLSELVSGSDKAAMETTVTTVLTSTTSASLLPQTTVRVSGANVTRPPPRTPPKRATVAPQRQPAKRAAPSLARVMPRQRPITIAESMYNHSRTNSGQVGSVIGVPQLSLFSAPQQQQQQQQASFTLQSNQQPQVIQVPGGTLIIPCQSQQASVRQWFAGSNASKQPHVAYLGSINMSQGQLSSISLNMPYGNVVSLQSMQQQQQPVLQNYQQQQQQPVLQNYQQQQQQPVLQNYQQQQQQQPVLHDYQQQQLSYQASTQLGFQHQQQTFSLVTGMTQQQQPQQFYRSVPEVPFVQPTLQLTASPPYQSHPAYRPASVQHSPLYQNFTTLSSPSPGLIQQQQPTYELVSSMVAHQEVVHMAPPPPPPQTIHQFLPMSSGPTAIHQQQVLTSIVQKQVEYAAFEASPSPSSFGSETPAAAMPSYVDAGVQVQSEASRPLDSCSASDSLGARTPFSIVSDDTGGCGDAAAATPFGDVVARPRDDSVASAFEYAVSVACGPDAPPAEADHRPPVVVLDSASPVVGAAMPSDDPELTFCNVVHRAAQQIASLNSLLESSSSLALSPSPADRNHFAKRSADRSRGAAAGVSKESPAAIQSRSKEGAEEVRSRCSSVPVAGGSGILSAEAQSVGAEVVDTAPSLGEPVDDAPRLMFEISSEDGLHLRSDNVDEAWRSIAERVQEMRAASNLRHVSVDGINGLNMLGVTHKAVQYLLEQLPGAKQCKKYKFRYHEQETTEEIPENPSGSARSEPVKARKDHDLFMFLASRHRLPPQFTPDEDEMQQRYSRRSTTLDLPMAMRFRHLGTTAKEAVGVYRSEIHGRGLFCKRSIDGGEMVMEYAGEVIRSVLTDKREKFYESKGIGCYMFRIDDNQVVDATMHGNAARFINHSCEPNCYSKVINVDGKKHIVIFALRRIVRGEELTYDYKFPIEDIKIPCTCGSRRCRRYLN